MCDDSTADHQDRCEPELKQGHTCTDPAFKRG